MTYVVFGAFGLYAIAFIWQTIRRRRRTPDVSGSPATKAMSIVIGELDSVFAPGTLHWRAEKQRIAMMRDEVDSGDKPFGPVDLDNDKAVIKIRRPDPE